MCYSHTCNEKGPSSISVLGVWCVCVCRVLLFDVCVCVCVCVCHRAQSLLLPSRLELIDSPASTLSTVTFDR